MKGLIITLLRRCGLYHVGSGELLNAVKQGNRLKQLFAL